MNALLFNTPRITSLLAIAGFSLMAAMVDFARRRRIASAQAMEIGPAAPAPESIADSAPGEPSQPPVLEAPVQPVTRSQAVPSTHSLARLPDADRAPARSLPVGTFLTLPKPAPKSPRSAEWVATSVAWWQEA